MDKTSYPLTKTFSLSLPSETLLAARRAAEYNSTTLRQVLKAFIEDYILATTAVALKATPEKVKSYTLDEIINTLLGVTDKKSYEAAHNYKRESTTKRKTSAAMAWTHIEKTDPVSKRKIKKCPHINVKVIPFGVWCINCAELIEIVDDPNVLFDFTKAAIQAKQDIKLPKAQ